MANGARIEALVQVGAEEWLAFSDPVRVVGADASEDVRPALTEVERLTRDAGLHAVGYVAYEAGAAWGPGAPGAPGLPGGLPLVWFALFEPGRVRRTGPPAAAGDYRLGPVSPTIDRAGFAQAFGRIKAHIAAGDTYQVNYTFRMTAAFEGDPRSLFADLVDAQRGAHAVYLGLGDVSICSASPELFFALDGLEVTTRPMKGTARRGRTLAEDRRQRDHLQQSPKERAENVMVVDMMRNDLGRIAQVGSVAAPELFVAERYPNVWQMTSLVTARSTASLEDVFAALHPPASVTGAPKVRTVEILGELEPGPRGIYTGAIGHVRPDGNASFSVAIRTAVVDHAAGRVEFGIGSGIVWDSEVDAEYEECLLKGTVLGRRPEPFDLLETLRWTSGEGFFLLDRHLERLRDSAEYFGVPCRLADVRASLEAAVAGTNAGGLRVRLLVARDGGVRIEHTPLVERRDPLTIRLAADPVDPSQPWLFHKTTNRGIYQRARAVAGPVDDVLLWNPAREITEATTANVVVEIDGVRVTPPVECGLLAGTYRAELLARGEIREAVISIDDLEPATRIWLVNSVHESRVAELVP